MFLLTDGTVLVHNANAKDWYRLTPDAQGNYETGNWSKAINRANTRQFFASGILRDGRVFAIGGEYSDAGALPTVTPAAVRRPRPTRCAARRAESPTSRCREARAPTWPVFSPSTSPTR
jgi:hypothetical protein